MSEQQTIISFNSIKEFNKFCDNAKIYPILKVESKKHSNMRGEFFHYISGILLLHGIEFKFEINESLVLKEKLAKVEEGRLYSELF